MWNSNVNSQKADICDMKVTLHFMKFIYLALKVIYDDWLGVQELRDSFWREVIYFKLSFQLICVEGYIQKVQDLLWNRGWNLALKTCLWNRATADVGIKLQSDAFFIYDNTSLTAVVLGDMIKIYPIFHHVVFLLMLGRRVQSLLCSYHVGNVSLFVMELWH
jgi:hypothetical protein